MVDLRHSADVLRNELEMPVERRRFGSGWFAGFFGLLLATAGWGPVLALHWPSWFATPELQQLTTLTDC